ncbi:MAG: hypothetical protein EZS28_053984, partial [Streblomastix strix]
AIDRNTQPLSGSAPSKDTNFKLILATIPSSDNNLQFILPTAYYNYITIQSNGYVSGGTGYTKYKIPSTSNSTIELIVEPDYITNTVTVPLNLKFINETEVPLLCIDINGEVEAAARFSNKSPRSSRRPTSVTLNYEFELEVEGILYLVYPVPPETYPLD